jgi:hypothetical protein
MVTAQKSSCSFVSANTRPIMQRVLRRYALARARGVMADAFDWLTASAHARNFSLPECSSAVVVKFYLGDAKNLTTFFGKLRFLTTVFPFLRRDKTGTHISHKCP